MTKKAVPSPLYWRYIGKGAFIPGVPARDLTPEEMAESQKIITGQAAITGQPLYEPVYEPQPEAEVNQ